MEANTARCFFAIELAPQTKKALATTKDTLSRLISTGWRWLPPENIHITLKFLGDTPKNRMSELVKETASILHNYTSFSANLSRMGVFPGYQKPRILWIGIQPEEPLIGLEKAISETTSKLSLSADSRPFSPHITLARALENQPGSSHQILRKVLDNYSPVSPLEFLIDQVTLFSSQLRPQGPLYTALARFPLQTELV